jgi:hypothetical protein
MLIAVKFHSIMAQNPVAYAKLDSTPVLEKLSLDAEQPFGFLENGC